MVTAHLQFSLSVSIDQSHSFETRSCFSERDHRCVIVPRIVARMELLAAGSGLNIMSGNDQA